MSDALRQAFDQAFASPPVPHERKGIRCLAVRVGDEALALRLEDVRGLERLRGLTPLPGATLPGLLGMVVLRGRLVAAYGLRDLLEAEGAGQDSWLVLSGGDEPVALAFSDFEGYVEADATSLRALDGDARSPWVRHVLELDGAVRGLLDVSMLMDTLRQRAASSKGERERQP
jgi:chemotaxis signal transduction protein